MDFLQKNVNITELSNLKTQAIAKYFFEIKTLQDIEQLWEVLSYATSPLAPLLQGEGNTTGAKKTQKCHPELDSGWQSNNKKLPILFIWGWTNMLFAFDIFQGIVIKNSLQGWNYDVNTKILETYSNEKIREIAESLENNFSQDLWHRFIGLPGSVWGAIFWNAGCFWLETENNLEEVQVYNFTTWNIEILKKEKCEFAYRTSLFKKTQNYFIISAKFDLSQKIEKYHSEVDNIYFREHKQPKGNTCGSFFKNPKIDTEKFCKKFPKLCEDCVKKISAGLLLEQSGMKWYHHNTAYFSDLHANFLMSHENGNHKDILELIQIAQQKVRKKFWIYLEPEVRIIWENWELKT